MDENTPPPPPPPPPAPSIAFHSADLPDFAIDAPPPHINQTQSLPFATVDPATPPRRRRMRARLHRIGVDGRATPSRRPTPTLNPAATEFVPTGRVPPKRKASSSACSAVKLSSPRATVSPSPFPVVSAEHLFGPSALMPNDDALESLLAEDDDEQSDISQLEIQDMRATGQAHPNANRERLQEALRLMRAQADKAKTIPDALQRQSAILFCRDRIPPREASLLPLSESRRPATDSFRSLRYLPLCPPSTSVGREAITNDMELTVLPSHRERIDNAPPRAPPSRARWPSQGVSANPLPLEIFDMITEFLSRDDIKSMRLVSKEFETKVSATLFWSSVVSFNTELYDMIDEYRPLQAARTIHRGKGKGRARGAPTPAAAAAAGLHWQNAKEDAEGKMYRGHGLRVFQGFGPHIRRFGMSFEVSEAQLARPPIKKELDHVDSYHGSYDWPHQQYTRFANLARLERTADETLRMKAAFSNLHKVQDLALSLDNGLGWLSGPDKSIHARVFQRPTTVFGRSRHAPDREMQEANAFWAAIQSCHRVIGHESPKEVSLVRRMLVNSPAELHGLQGTRYTDTTQWLSIAAERAAPAVALDSPDDVSLFGVLYTTFNQAGSSDGNLYDKSALVPSELRKEQKEWLMETDWAQRAFLECYMLAITDNPFTFVKVKTLTIAKVSSGLLPILARESFWDALPSLSDVTIHVKPDWRTVEKDNAGFAEAYSRNPSDAVNSFHRSILRDRICLRPSITKLNIGWIGGGEHAEGVFARNNHLLPAPITPLENSTGATGNFGLVFKFVEHLTLTNCWITPPMLEELVIVHATQSLKSLVLDSISMTAHPKFPAGGQAAIQQQVAPAIAAGANAQLPLTLGAHVANPQGLLANVQQWLNNQGPHVAVGHLQQMLQQHGQQWGAAVPPVPLPLQPPQPQQAGVQLIAPPMQQTGDSAPSHWTNGHREGSWPEVIDKISPGPRLSDFVPRPAPWEEQSAERRRTNLQSIEFKSCGYAKLLNNNSFDQFAIEAGHDQHLSIWFRSRQAALTSAMMSTSDRHLGKIIQRIPETESNALLLAWGLTERTWATGADEPEYDGLLAGGTGRFSGVIDRNAAVGATETA